MHTSKGDLKSACRWPNQMQGNLRNIMYFFIAIVSLPKFYHNFHFYSIPVQLCLSTSGRQFPAFTVKAYQKAESLMFKIVFPQN